MVECEFFYKEKEMKKTILSAALLLAITPTLSYAVSGEYVFRVKTPDTDILGTEKWITTQDIGDWLAKGELIGCDEAAPLTSTIEYGVEFTQTQSCTQNMEQAVTTTSEHKDTGEIKVSVATNTRQDTVVNEIAATGEMIVRNMCVDILERNPGSGNGTYSVDPDGVGPISARNAYCAMTTGGWTLLDNFGNFNYDIPAYNAPLINSMSAVSSAGYTHNLTHYNYSDYIVNKFYSQLIRSGSATGYIQKAMPEWATGVRVDIANWYGGFNDVDLDGYTKTISTMTYPNQTTVTFRGTGMLTISERPSGIMWIDAIYVK